MLVKGIERLGKGINRPARLGCFEATQSQPCRIE